MRIRSKQTGTFFKGVALGAAVAMVTLVASAAVAGTGVGKVFNLGQDNRVNARSQLEGSTPSAVLKVTNTNQSASASGVAINVPASNPPLVVNSSTKVKNLNADLLDGADSSALQQRVTSTCANHTAIVAVGSNGSVSCTQSAVYAIHDSMGIGDAAIIHPFAPSGLNFVAQCIGPEPVVEWGNFKNTGFGNGSLNVWSQVGGLAPLITHILIGPGLSSPFQIGGGSQLEGQFIWFDAQGVVTFHLHALRFPGGCEYAGTAEVAALSESARPSR